MAHEFKVGDYARSIESGWLGKIQDLKEEVTPVDDTRSFTEIMATMIGVDELARVVGGLDVDEALASNDIQHFSTADLVPVVRPLKKIWGYFTDASGERTVRVLGGGSHKVGPPIRAVDVQPATPPSSDHLAACVECGNPCVINDDATANHINGETREVDHDLDANHVAVPDTGEYGLT